MIIVIADDLTGAAELAGMALRCNLSVEMITELHLQTQPDVLVIATDTRSTNEKEAIEIITEATRWAIALKPSFLFKKIDSVLRGHVLAEVQTQLAETGFKKALIVSANPSLDRTIVSGIYYYKGQPIHLSSFSSDPEFPITTSDVVTMLGANDKVVQVKKPGDHLPATGIIVGEVETSEDLAQWADHDLTETLIVGASGLFNALLQKMGYKASTQNDAGNIVMQGPNLFVCGTSFQKSRNAIKQLEKEGGPVAYIPLALLLEESEQLINKWSDEVVSLVQTYDKAVMAIEAEYQGTFSIDALHLRTQMAKAAKQIVQQITITNLFIEGGSTASAILKETGISRLIPTNEIAPGSIRSYAPQQALHIIMKPGSYDWPKDVWALTSNKHHLPYEPSKLTPG
jgi:uncharacterized protein YgbK (DUF1537 family)